MITKRMLGIALAGGLLLAACGDDDDSGGSSDAGSNEYSQALADSFREEEDMPLDDDQVDCLSEELGAAVGGPEAFEDAGLSPEDLVDADDLSATDLEVGEAESEAVAESFGTCDISLTEVFLADLGEIPQEAADCIEENLSDDDLATIFGDLLVFGDDEIDDLPPDVMNSLAECAQAG